MYPSSFILRMPTPNRAAARLGVRDVFIFLMGIFCVIQILFFVYPLIQIELLLDLD